MKKRQLAKLGLTLGLVAAVGVGGTMALLSAQSNTVENTFAVGNNLKDTDLKLDEWPLQNDNKTANTTAKERVKELHFENLMPLDERDKDPMVQIAKNAANCYVFVNVAGLEDLKEIGITVNWNEHWKKLDGTDATLDGVYYYQTGKDNVVKPAELPNTILSSDNYGELPALFTKVTVAKDSTLYDVKGELPKIKAVACAVQAANIANVDAAGLELPEKFYTALTAQAQ